MTRFEEVMARVARELYGASIDCAKQTKEKRLSMTSLSSDEMVKAGLDACVFAGKSEAYNLAADYIIMELKRKRFSSDELLAKIRLGVTDV
jgi:hypothetical protein